MNKTDDLPELTEEQAEDYVGECYKIKGKKVEVHKKNCKHKSTNINWISEDSIPVIDYGRLLNTENLTHHITQMTIREFAVWRTSHPNVIIVNHRFLGNDAVEIEYIE